MDFVFDKHLPLECEIISTNSKSDDIANEFPPFDQRILLTNPSNSDEILIFNTLNLRKTIAYNVAVKSYKLYYLSEWSKIL